MTTVSQEAREAAENFMNAHGWLCEEDWSLVLEADREVIVKFFAKFEQSIRQSTERAFEERERKLREANQRLRNGYADAVSGYNYIIANHGRLSGVGFDRVQDHFFEWVTMPEREGLIAGSHDLARQALKETPDAQ